MASINGVQIKSLKSFVEHEGMTAFQGNVYVNGKKQGFWTQDFNCGPDHFHFQTDALDARAEDFKLGHPESYEYREYIDAESLLSKIVSLMKDEKMYKKNLKQGRNVLVLVTDNYHIEGFSIKIDAEPEVAKEMVVKKYSAQIEKLKAQMFKNVVPSVRVFASLEDFDLTIGPDHPAPEWMQAA